MEEINEVTEEVQADGRIFKKTVRTEEEKRALQIRLNRIVGQMNGVKKMVDNDRYCEDLLIQLAAIVQSVKGLATTILDDHLHRCVAEGIKTGDTAPLDGLMELIRRYN